MRTDVTSIAAAFDARAATYNQNDWHRHVANALVAHCRLRPGQTVLDAGTGTGFAAFAAANAVGARGRVIAVDLSAGMLAVAKQHVSSADSAPITWQLADAVALGALPSDSFDAVLSAAALLYMPVGVALSEWHRLLKPGGLVGFTAMQRGSPVASQVFREAASAYGIHLPDPSQALGTTMDCDAALREAGFQSRTVTSMTVAFSAEDVGVAWGSNLASPAHAAVHTLSPDLLARMKANFDAGLQRREQVEHGSTMKARILLATGTRGFSQIRMSAAHLPAADRSGRDDAT